LSFDLTTLVRRKNSDIKPRTRIFIQRKSSPEERWEREREICSYSKEVRSTSKQDLSSSVLPSSFPQTQDSLQRTSYGDIGTETGTKVKQRFYAEALGFKYHVE